MAQLVTNPEELRYIGQKAGKDFNAIPDDGTEFPNLSKLKDLKLKLGNLESLCKDIAITMEMYHSDEKKVDKH